MESNGDVDRKDEEGCSDIANETDDGYDGIPEFDIDVDMDREFVHPLHAGRNLRCSAASGGRSLLSTESRTISAFHRRAVNGGWSVLFGCRGRDDRLPVAPRTDPYGRFYAYGSRLG